MWWKKDEVIGFGSFGTVYLGVPGHPSSAWFPSPSCVAVKSAVLKNSDSLQHEEEFLYSLRGHPNFIHCYGTDTSLEEDGTDTSLEKDEEVVYNLLLEYAPGGTLQSLIQSGQGKMSEPEVASYTYQLLKGLLHLDTLGIVHCDLKSDNVLVFPMQDEGVNRLKIADFGLAIRDNAEDNLTVDFSKKYVCRGMLQYTSPESFVYGIHKAPKDIWALGCIIVEMITGNPVWEHCRKEELELKIEYQEPKIPENISAFCKDFLNKCLNRNSNGRWSAFKLMAHPFIWKNFASVIYWNKQDSDYELPENPFGYDDQWIKNKDLFSAFNKYFFYACMDDEQE